MAAARRSKTASLIDRLFREPFRFSFFQAVRILEQKGRKDAGSTRVKAVGPVGDDSPPDEEVVQFRAQASLNFPGSEISAIDLPGRREEGTATGRSQMTVGFMGLTGPSGVLPEHYTALMVRNIRAKNLALRDFFDLINHRAISLFYRAWGKYRLTETYERAGGAGGATDDPITSSLYALVGFENRHLRNRLAVDDETLIYYAGGLVLGSRPAIGLETMLSDYFDMPVTLSQFQGRWLGLRESDRSAFRPDLGGEPGYCQLGVDAVAGDRVWDVQSCFRIKLGPLSYEDFVTFMPDGPQMKKLAQLTRLYAGPERSFDVELTLKKEEVPFCRLEADGSYEPRLGWNSWLKQHEVLSDRADAIFVPDQV
jgi:type VI secretion system protein ImpH